MKKIITSVAMTGFLAIAILSTTQVKGAINCPNGGPVNLSTEDEDNWTEGISVPPSLESIAGALMGFLGIGNINPEPIMCHLQHWEICCNDGTDTKGEWKTYWKEQSFEGTLTASVGVSLSGWYGQIVDAILGGGYEDPDLQGLDDALSGLDATGAGISGTIAASYYDPYQVMDTCACGEDEYETFLGSIDYSVAGAIGQYNNTEVPDMEVPTGPDIEVSLLEVNFHYRKAGVIGGSTALVTETLSGTLESYYAIGSEDVVYLINLELPELDEETPNPWCILPALTTYQ